MICLPSSIYKRSLINVWLQCLQFFDALRDCSFLTEWHWREPPVVPTVCVSTKSTPTNTYLISDIERAPMLRRCPGRKPQELIPPEQQVITTTMQIPTTDSPIPNNEIGFEPNEEKLQLAYPFLRIAWTFHESQQIGACGFTRPGLILCKLFLPGRPSSLTKAAIRADSCPCRLPPLECEQSAFLRSRTSATHLIEFAPLECRL